LELTIMKGNRRYKRYCSLSLFQLYNCHAGVTSLRTYCTYELWYM